MSIRTLLIWIIIAGLLGGAAVLVRERQARAAGLEEVRWAGLVFDPAGVVSVTVEGESEGGSVRIVREADSIDGWRGSWGSGGDWALSSSRVRGGLRALATARVRLSDEPLFASATRTVTLGTRGGARVELGLGGDRSGGRVPVRVEQRDEGGAIERVLTGWLDAGVADAFTPEAVLGWRDPRLLDLAASSVSRVALHAGEHAVTLVRGASGWRITEPIGLHAERESVDALVRTLLSIKAVRFVEGEIDDSTSGLGSPLARIEVGAGDSVVALTIGTRADVRGDTLYARFERGGRATLVTVSTDALAKLTAVPDAYVSKSAGAFAMTAVRTVRVRGRDGTVRMEATRDGAGWSIGETPADALTGESVDRLLTLLLREKAAGVRLVDAAAELPRAIAGVELVDRAGVVLGSFDVALGQGPGGMQLLVIDALDGVSGNGRRVVWAYSGDAAQATGTWLTVAASRAASGG